MDSKDKPQGVGRTEVDTFISNKEPQHLDANLYYRAFSLGTRSAPSEDDSLLLARLSRLAVPTSAAAHFAATVRETLQTHPQLKAIKRVCLVRRLGFANHLEVISSDGEAPVETMRPGYRCFVAPDSSLFKLAPGHVRIFTSAAKIVETFVQRGHPPQRTIARIAAMKLLSGLCTGIFSGQQMNGLLFFNATDDFLAELPVDYLSIVSYIAVQAQRHFLGKGPEGVYRLLWQNEERRLASAPYEAATLAEDLKWVFGCMFGTEEIKGLVEGAPRLPSLLVHGHLAYIVGRLASAAGAKAVKLTLTTSGAFVRAKCEFAGCSLVADSMLIRAILLEAEDFGYTGVVLTPTQIQLSTDFDKVASVESICYSVESELSA